MIEKELPYLIMQVAYDVHNELGPGLKATGLEPAIVINFGSERVQASRVVNTKSKKTSPPFP